MAALLVGCTNTSPTGPTPAVHESKATTPAQWSAPRARLLAMPAGFDVASPGEPVASSWTPLAKSDNCLLSYRGDVLPRPASPATYREESAKQAAATVRSEQGANVSPAFDVFLALDPTSSYMADGPLGVNAVALDFAGSTSHEATRIAARVALAASYVDSPTLQALQLRFTCSGDVIVQEQWNDIVAALRFDQFAAPYEHLGQWPTQTIESDYAPWDRANQRQQEPTIS